MDARQVEPKRSHQLRKLPLSRFLLLLAMLLAPSMAGGWVFMQTMDTEQEDSGKPAPQGRTVYFPVDPIDLPAPASPKNLSKSAAIKPGTIPFSRTGVVTMEEESENPGPVSAPGAKNIEYPVLPPEMSQTEQLPTTVAPVLPDQPGPAFTPVAQTAPLLPIAKGEFTSPLEQPAPIPANVEWKNAKKFNALKNGVETPAIAPMPKAEIVVEKQQPLPMGGTPMTPMTGDPVPVLLTENGQAAQKPVPESGQNPFPPPPNPVPEAGVKPAVPSGPKNSEAIPLPEPRPVGPTRTDGPSCPIPGIFANGGSTVCPQPADMLGRGPGHFLGETPIPTPAYLKFEKRYAGPFLDPQNTIDLMQGRARLWTLNAVPKRIQVSDEAVVTYTLFGAKDITLLGKRVGTTVMNLWFTDADDPTKEAVLSYLVRVFPDSEAVKRREQELKTLENSINKAFPDSLIVLKLIGDKVQVSGQAHDIQDVTQILKILVASPAAGARGGNAPTDAGAAKAAPGAPAAPMPGQEAGKGQPTAPGPENYISSGSPYVINMIRITGVQQVMLRVVIAEVNRVAARSIGLNFSITNQQGVQVFANNTGFLNSGALGFGGGGFGGSALAGSSASGLSGINPLVNLPLTLGNGQVNLAINALKKMSYAKSLAEPTIVALNGQTANFSAGGSFPVPIVVGGAGVGLQGVSYVPYGVQLTFTPFITDRDRIRLNLNAVVSTRDTTTSSATTIGGASVPSLNSRNFNSTLELREGQTLAVAGLIQTNLGTDRDQLPFFAEIPFLNRLTGFDRTSAGEQELVILITPELAQPMNSHQVPRLPGSDLFEPSDLEFYLLGRLEGRRMDDFRSPVMNDYHRIRRYNQCEQIYIFGPTGHQNTQTIENR